jgi:predicted GIY-YIG superfamily endonuclease
MTEPLGKVLSSGSLSLPRDGETYVYRAYCRCGDLLYVGVAGCLYTRLADHRRSRARWEVRAVRVEWDIYPSRAVALVEEERLIRELKPVYNVTHVGRRLPQPIPWPKCPPRVDPDVRRLGRARALSVGDRL